MYMFMSTRLSWSPLGSLSQLDPILELGLLLGLSLSLLIALEFYEKHYTDMDNLCFVAGSIFIVFSLK